MNEKLENLYPRKLRNSSNLMPSEIPEPEEITNIEHFKPCYQKLYQYVKDLVMEKEQILQSLRMETVTNEEQKNYIEMLKQTLENSILKNGIQDVLNAQKPNYNRDMGNMDILVDVTNVRAECEKFRKESLRLQMTNDQLIEEVEDLRKIGEDLSLKNVKLNEEIENLLIKHDQKENIINYQKEENEKIIVDNEKLAKNNEKLTREIGAVNLRNVDLEKEKSDFNRKNIDLLGQVFTHFKC